MSDQSSEPLKLVVAFTDKHFPQEVLNLLSESSKKIIWEHFRDVFLKENVKKPYAYQEDVFNAHIMHLAKKAFDQHNNMGGYPGDDVQKIMAKIDFMAETSLKGDYGATATQHLHPKVTFD